MINIERQFNLPASRLRRTGKLSKKIKQYKCNLCSRSIKHKGNCLSCNLRAKRKKEDQVGLLVNQIVSIKSFKHEEIQTQTKKILESLGYFVELEKKIQARKPGRIDLFAKKDSFLIGIEIDHSFMRWKSIDKLNTLKPRERGRFSFSLMIDKKFKYVLN